MLHIVFQREDIKTLSKSFELDESLSGEIILIEDDFSIGPLKNIFSEEGIELRKNWWLDITGDPNDARDESVSINSLKEKLNNNEDAVVWIWVAPNKQDVTGYYWSVSQLKEFAGRVYVLSLNNLPFINDKGHIFYPSHLFEIPAREFLKAKKLARPVSISEFEIDPDEWTKISNEDKGIRILEGAKKLKQADYDFFDEELKKHITADWQKGAKIIHQFMSKTKDAPSEDYFLWRLKKMIAEDLFDVQGKVESLKDFELKQKAD